MLKIINAGLGRTGTTSLKVALDRLGFPLSSEPEIVINIGADDAPDKARIILTWPLPPAETAHQAEAHESGDAT